MSENILQNNPFVQSKQKDIAGKEVFELMGNHLSLYFKSGECRNADNGVCTSCNCIKNISNNSFLENRVAEVLVEYNFFSSKNQTLYLQGIALQGFILKQRRNKRDKWTPKYHIKGVIDGDSEQYFVCQNGLRRLFCIGYKKWNTIVNGIRVPTIEAHKNVGNCNASFEYTSEVLEYLMEVAHEEGASQATRFIQELTGIGICNDEKFGLHFHHTKPNGRCMINIALIMGGKQDKHPEEITQEFPNIYYTKMTSKISNIK